MRNSFKKALIISVAILPFLWLTLSFCCVEMRNAKSDAMNMVGMASANTMPSGDAIQKGLSFSGDPCQSSQFQCEKLTERYDNSKVNVDSPRSAFSNAKTIHFTNTTFSVAKTQLAFSNYDSPPKLVLNSLPLYLQISVLRL